MLKGNGVSGGIGIAQAMVWHTSVAFDYVPRKSTHPETELQQFEKARANILNQTGDMQSKTARLFGDDEAVIFDAYRLILNDEELLLEPLRQKIVDEHYSAPYAVATQFDEIARRFLNIEDEYLRQRVDDVFALRDQLTRELMGMYPADVSHLDRPTILIAHSISPVDIASLDLSRLVGIVCETGGYTSHASIISRTLGLPAVMGLEKVTRLARHGDLIALDGESGEVWINPDANELAMLRLRSDRITKQRDATQQFYGLPTVSLDGRRVELCANIGQLSEADRALAADAESIGMYRTELLFAASPEPPDEEQQFQNYCSLLKTMKGQAVTVRTFDDSGYYAKETTVTPRRRDGNPVLGYRGIRMSLGRPSMFRTQLRALLRASAYGSLRVMFPMVSNLDEVDAALQALAHIKEELRREDLPFDEKLPVGIAIEVPASALLSQAIAPKVDFLSININDLIQFTLAIDRGNPELAYLYHQYHPAILRLVGHTVESAHQAGIPCVLCGEAPGQERVLPLLFGLGLDGFSMNPNTILRARQILNNCNYAVCKRMASEILELHSTEEVARRLSEMELPV